MFSLSGSARFGVCATGSCLLLGFALASPPPARSTSPAAVVASLDKFIQPRFQEDAGVFGTARIGIQGHDAVLKTERTKFEKQLMAKVDASGRKYTVGFFHCIVKPGKFIPSEDPDSRRPVQQDAQPSYSLYYLVDGQNYSNGGDGVPEPPAHNWEKKYGAKVKAACIKAMPRLKQGQKVQTTVAGWTVAMRPIRAEQQSCLNCHKTAKRGDTLGVMVYTVR